MRIVRSNVMLFLAPFAVRRLATVAAFIEANGLPSSDYIICKTTNITSWNDDKARTKEEVLAAFDKAINHERMNIY